MVSRADLFLNQVVLRLILTCLYRGQIDPAVWYGWPEVDISMMWLSPRPSASDRFFSTWEAIVSPKPGWTDRAPLLHVREMLSVLAQFGDDNGTADRLQAVIMPFRRRA